MDFNRITYKTIFRKVYNRLSKFIKRYTRIWR